jgi:hypothetical protein
MCRWRIRSIKAGVLVSRIGSVMAVRLGLKGDDFILSELHNQQSKLLLID